LKLIKSDDLNHNKKSEQGRFIQFTRCARSWMTADVRMEMKNYHFRVPGYLSIGWGLFFLSIHIFITFLMDDPYGKHAIPHILILVPIGLILLGIFTSLQRGLACLTSVVLSGYSIYWLSDILFRAHRTQQIWDWLFSITLFFSCITVGYLLLSNIKEWKW